LQRNLRLPKVSPQPIAPARGGTPVFVGTRVPLRKLFDYLERGHSLEDFLDAFPSVSREQAIAARQIGDRRNNED
jgi:uncharacterized protein (DUF433 family)